MIFEGLALLEPSLYDSPVKAITLSISNCISLITKGYGRSNYRATLSTRDYRLICIWAN